DRQPRRCRRRDGKTHPDHVRRQRPKVDDLRFEPVDNSAVRGRVRLVGPRALNVLAALMDTALIDRGYFEVVRGPAGQAGRHVAGGVGAIGGSDLDLPARAGPLVDVVASDGHTWLGRWCSPAQVDL